MTEQKKSSKSASLPTPEMARVSIEQCADAMMLGDIETLDLIYANPAAERMLGRSLQEILGMKVTDITPEKDVPYVLDQFARQAKGNSALARNIPIIDASKNVKFYDVHSVPAQIDGRECLIGSFRDVTEKLEVEKELLDGEERFRLAIQSLPMGLFHYRLDESEQLILAGANPACSKILGISVNDHVGQVLEDIFPPLAETEVPDAYRTVAKEGGVWTSEQVSYKDDRIEGAFEIVAFQLKPLEVGVLFWDVTEKKKAEEDMRRVMAAINGMGESVLIADRESMIQYVNPCFEELTGYSLEEVVGKNIRILQSGVHDDEFYSKIRDVLAEGTAWSGHFVNRKKDGSLFHERATISPVKNDAGDVVNYVAVKRDVTHELDLEKRVVRSQKMASLGQFAHRVAHDVTNGLSTILGSAEIISRSTPDPASKEMADMIVSAVDRIAALTTDLMGFASTAKLSVKKQRLSKMLMGMSEMIDRTCHPNIKVSYEMDDEVYVKADTSQLEQVIMHLVVNATEAIEGVGAVRITVGKGSMPAELGLDAPARSNSEIPAAILSFVDDGPGLTIEECARACEPFFSTKRDLRRYAGLGLATVYGIVSRHDGDIALSSAEGQGTTVRIALPLVE
jgi:two-component system cell cycle sensor histidine kinase/response regulator CckA